MITLEQAQHHSWSCPDDPGEIGMDLPRLSVTAEERDILAGLFQGRRVVEIGTGLGVSTRAIAQSAERVLTHDIDPWVIANVPDSLPGNVEFTQEREFPGEYDAGFIDGNHLEHEVAADILSVSRAIGPGRVIALHDTHMKGVKAGIKSVGCHVFVSYTTKCALALAWSVAT